MQKIFRIFLYSIIISSLSIIIVYAQTSDTVALTNSVLVINSKPSQSIVFIDSNFVGYTPISISAIKGKHHIVEIREAGFLPFQGVVSLNSNDTLVLKADLEHFSGSVSVFTDNIQSSIKIDGKEYSKGRIDTVSLITGEHEVSIYNPSFQRNVSSSFKVETQQHLSLKSEYNIVSIPRLISSIILPGYAQIDDKNYLKGVGLIFAGIGSIVYMLSENTKYSLAEQDYKSALNDYDHTNNDIAVEQARNVANRKQDTYNVMKRRFWISIGVVALVWIGNALDVTFNHLLTDRIKIYAGGNCISSQKTLYADYDFSLSIGM